MAALALGLGAAPAAAIIVPFGDQFSVKDGQPNNEHSPAIAFAQSGVGVIAWTDSIDGIRARFLDSSGALVPDDVLLVTNVHVPGFPASGRETYRKDPAVFMLSDGGFWLFWTDEQQDVVRDFFHEKRKLVDRDVYGQRFDAAGQALGVSVRIATGTAFQSRPQVQSLGCDRAHCALQRFVVAWESAGEGIWGQIFDVGGAALGAPLRLSSPGATQTVALQQGPAGGFIAAWEEPDPHSPRSWIVGRFFDVGGRPLGPAFAISPRTPGAQRRASLVWCPSTAEATAVFDRTMPANGRYRVVGQRFAPPARVVGEPVMITSGGAEAPSATALTPAETVLALWVSWESDYPAFIRGLELDAKSARPSTEFQVADWPRYDLTVAAAPSGRLLVVWEGFVYGTRHGILARWLQQIP